MWVCAFSLPATTSTTPIRPLLSLCHAAEKLVCYSVALHLTYAQAEPIHTHTHIYICNVHATLAQVEIQIWLLLIWFVCILNSSVSLLLLLSLSLLLSGLLHMAALLLFLFLLLFLSTFLWEVFGKLACTLALAFGNQTKNDTAQKANYNNVNSNNKTDARRLWNFVGIFNWQTFSFSPAKAQLGRCDLHMYVRVFVWDKKRTPFWTSRDALAAVCEAGCMPLQISTQTHAYIY